MHADARTQVLERFDGKLFTLEFKYDGERAQIHFKRGKKGGFTKVYSRNLEDNTGTLTGRVARGVQVRAWAARCKTC